MKKFTKKIIVQSAKSVLVFFLIFTILASSFAFSIGPATDSIAYAAFNAQINYQGKLTNSSNVAVADGVYHMKFWLLTSPTAATTTAIWTEDRSTVAGNRVTVTNGLFSLMLGSSTPFTGVDFNQTLYLGVEVGGSGGSPTWDGEMSPRKVLGAVPAAFVSDKLDNISSEQFLRADAANATSTATNYLTFTQTGAGSIAQFLGQGSAPVFNILSGGNLGVGTTSPWAKFSIGTVGLSSSLPSFVIASSSVGIATTTQFIVKNGDVGLGTSTPSKALAITRGDTPTIRLYQDTTGGFTQQTWDIGGNDANFFIRDATSGTLPFRIFPGAPGNSVLINSSGLVGIGGSPTYKLDVFGEGHFSSYADASYFVATSSATSTFVGGLTVKALNVTSSTASSTFANGINLNAGCFAVSGTCLPTTAISSLSQTYGSAQTGAITLATSSATSFNGLTVSNSITNSGGTFTFAPPTISGTLSVAGGGTGATSHSYRGIAYYDGSVLQGTSGLTYDPVSYQLGIPGSNFTSSVLFGNYSSVGALKNGAGFIMGTSLQPATTTDNSVMKTSSDQGSFFYTRYDRGLEFHTGLAGAAGTILADTSNLRMSIDNSGSVYMSSLGTGLVKSASGILSNATAGTDYQAPITTGTGLSFSGSTLNSVWATSSTSIYNTNAGNVGVGTTSPWKKLSVTGDIVLTGSFYDSLSSAGTNGMILQSTGSATKWMATSSLGIALSDTTGTLPINRGGTNATSQTTNGVAYYNGTSITSGSNLVFDGTKLGIGTSPSAPLHLSSAGGASNGIRLDVTNASSYSTIDFYTPTGLNGQFVSTGASFSNGLIGGDQTVLANELTNGALQLGALGTNGYVTIFSGGLASGNERLRITSGGNVGIGTTSPYAMLSVAGDVVARSFVATSTATSTFTGGLTVKALNVTSSTASSTFANGINLSAGCFAVSGTCLPSTAISSLSQTYGSAQTGAITLATSSATTFNGLTISNSITNSGGTFTFAPPTVSGTLTVAGGGTGATSFTSGSVIFSNGTSLTQDNSNFYWDNSGKKLGIGTSTPFSTLSVSTASQQNGLLPLFAVASTTKATLFNVLGSGNVGIGTANPGALLNVYKAGGTGLQQILRLTAGGTSVGDGPSILFQDYYDGNYPNWQMAEIGAAYEGSYKGDLVFRTNFGGADTNISERMRILYNGNVGIGTTTPGTLLSLGNTGSNTINLDTTSTSTFGTGINIRSGCFAVSGTCLPTTAISSLSQTYGSAQTGAITLATSSATSFNGLTVSNSITNSGGTFTFAPPTVSGTLTVAGGGTGATSFGQGWIYSTGSGALAASTSPTVNYINATSTTKTSTFAGGLTVAGLTTLSGTTNSQTLTSTLFRASAMQYADTSAMTDSTPNLYYPGINVVVLDNGGGIHYSNTNYFVDLSGNIHANNASTAIDSTNNHFASSLAVGTSSPWGKLSVSTTAQQSGTLPLLVVASTTKATLFDVLGNGNVGIGTTSPVTNLSVSGSGYITGGLGVGSTNIGTEAIFADAGPGARTYALRAKNYQITDGIPTYGVYSDVSQTDGGSFLGTEYAGYFKASGSVYQSYGLFADVSGSGSTQKYALYAQGGQSYFSTNVGIGTTTPGTLLSLGNTGSNTINLDTTSTSTFGTGINIRSGCFAIGGTCIGGSGGSGTVNSGTTGQFPYYAGSGTTLTATSSLFLSTTSYVGVGSTTPWAKLSVSGTAQQDGRLPLFAVSSTTKATLFNVLGNGNVGVGTSSPYTALAVSGEAAASNFVAYSTTATSTLYGGLSVVTNGGSNTFNILQNGNIGINTPNPNVPFIVNTNGSGLCGESPTFTVSLTAFLNEACDIQFGDLSFNGNGTQFLIDGQNGKFNFLYGNVGIGTTTPSGVLSVTGSGTGTGRAFVIANSSNAEKFTVLDNGNVGIGDATPSSALDVNGDVRVNSGNQLVLASSTDANLNKIYAATDAFNTSQDALYLTTSGTDHRIMLGTSSTHPYSLYAGYLNQGIEGLKYLTMTGGTAEMLSVTRSDAGIIAGFGANGSANLVTLSYGVSGTENQFLSTFGQLVIGTSGAYPLILRPNSGQNVGVNENTPGSLMSISGNAAIGANYSAIAAPTNGLLVQGNVGFGTTSPWAKLSIGTHNLAVTTPSFVIASSSTGVATSTQFVVVNGNVGINTASPGYKLDVNGYAKIGDGTSATGLTIDGFSGDFTFVDGSRFNTTRPVMYQMFDNSAGSIDFLNGKVLFNGTTGNVGIGTTTPGTLLSLGNTGSNTINLDTTSTSTFGTGINIRSGCFAIGGTCIGGSGGSGTVNSGTTGQFPYYASAGTAVTATSTLFVSTASYVGVGSTTPWAKLSVSGTAQQDGRLPLFAVSSTTKAALFNVLGNGNVGIANASPAEKLSIGSLTSTLTATPDRLSLGGTYGSNTPGNSGNLKLKVYDDGSSLYGLGISSAMLEYQVPSGSVHAWFVNSSEKARIDSTGLSVTGNGYVSGAMGVGVTNTNAGTLSVLATGSGATNAIAQLTVPNKVSATRMISFKESTSGADWNIWMGTESVPYFYIGGSGGTSQYFWRANWNDTSVPSNTFKSASDTAGQTVVGILGASGQTGDYLQLTASGATAGNIFKVTSSGNVGIGTTSPYAMLSVAGDVVARSFVATSTTATSTFAGFIDVNGTGTNATSTFASNLWVKGALKIGTSSIYIDTNGISSTDGTLKLRAGSTATSTFPLLSVGTTTATTTAKLFVDGAFKLVGTRNEIVIGDTFGNTRGTSSIDIQSYRATASQVASGGQSIAIGFRNTASGATTTAIGYGNSVSTTNAPSTALGWANTISGYGQSIALGESNSITADTAIAAGYGNVAGAGGATAIGYQSQVSGSLGTAIGTFNVAQGAYSAAIGYQNSALYDYTTAVGYQNTISSGQYNVAFGTGNNISTNDGYSGAFGIANNINSTASNPDTSFAFGYNNTIDSQSNGGNSAFGNNNVVQYGNGAEHSMAFGYDLIVTTTDTVEIGATDDAKLVLGKTPGWIGYGIKNNAGTGSLCFDSNDKSIYVNDFTDNCTSSTRSTKHDIQNLEINGLRTIKSLTPVSFVYNNSIDGRTNYGFIADDASLVDSHLGTYNADHMLTGIDDKAFISISVKAIKEIADRISFDDAPTTTPSIAINSLGNVGIGMDDATYKLQAKGDVAGYGFAITVDEADMEHVHTVNEEGLGAYAEKLHDINIATYSFAGDTGTTTRLGILGDDAPSEILTATGDIDLYKLSVFTLGAVKAQQLRLDSIEERLASIEAVISGGGGGGFWSGSLQSLEDLGVSITESLAQFKNVLVASLTVGSSEKPSGITLYDEANGNPYCVKVVHGKLKNFAGTCEDGGEEEIPDEDNGPTGTSTPPVIDNGGDATSTPPTTSGGDPEPAVDNTHTEPTQTPDPIVSDNGGAGDTGNTGSGLTNGDAGSSTGSTNGDNGSTSNNTGSSNTGGDTGSSSGSSNTGGDGGSSSNSSNTGGDSGSSSGSGDSGSTQP